MAPGKMLIDGQKWSCEACIRGHRVSSCKHRERPLTRINRKGRPFSACSVCHCTPCRVPEEHVRLRRETESRGSLRKQTTGRLSRPSAFLPIAPRPAATTPAPATVSRENVNGEKVQKTSGVSTENDEPPYDFSQHIPMSKNQPIPQPPSLSESIPSASSPDDMPVPFPVSLNPLDDPVLPYNDPVPSMDSVLSTLDGVDAFPDPAQDDWYTTVLGIYPPY